MFTRHPIDWILTSDPTALGLALTALSVATALCVLLALFWLVRLPRRAVAPRCAKCRYMLAEPVPARCSECGSELADANAVRRHGRGVRWRPALVALGLAGIGFGVQWWIGAGWMPYGVNAARAVDAWQRRRTDPALHLIAPEVFVARAIEEVALLGSVRFNPVYLASRNFLSQPRLAALRDAVLDPATRVMAFAAAREMQDRFVVRGDLVSAKMPNAEHAQIRRMLVDAVIVDPTLIGAVAGADGVLEIPAFEPDSPLGAYRYQAFSFAPEQAVDLNNDFFLDIPYSNEIIGCRSEIAQVRGVMTHADGRRASRTIRFVATAPDAGMVRSARIWFVPAPTPDPAKWTVSVEGEIRHRFVSEIMRDGTGQPLERVLPQRFKVDIDRVEIRPSAP